MTVANSNNRTRLNISANTDYDFTFRIDEDTDLLVYLIDADGVATLQTLATNYSVAISTVTEGGTVSFFVIDPDTSVATPTAPVGAEVLMIRSKPYVQSADIPVRGGFNESVIEGLADALEMQIQQLKELVDYSVKQDPTTVAVNVVMPTPEDGLAPVWKGTTGEMQNAPVDAGAITDGIIAAEAAQTAAEAAQTAAEAAAASTTPLVDVLKAVMPVGFVVTLGVSTNPATLYGFGTWTAIVGKVIVGIDGTQTEFDTLNETGGAKTHQLTIAEMPAHTHKFSYRQDVPAGTTARAATYNGTADTNYATNSTGGDGAHNNLQPYIVKYVWERTA